MGEEIEFATHQRFHQGAELFGDDGKLQERCTDVGFLFGQGDRTETFQCPYQTHLVVYVCWEEIGKRDGAV